MGQFAYVHTVANCVGRQSSLHQLMLTDTLTLSLLVVCGIYYSSVTTLWGNMYLWWFCKVKLVWEHKLAV